MKKNLSFAVGLTGLLGLCVFASASVRADVAAASSPTNATIRVGSFNIRLSTGDIATVNDWGLRKGDVVALIRKMDLDAFGLQEVRPDQAGFLRKNLGDEYEFVGDHRGPDRKTDEASPVFYRRSRFAVLDKGTFWLSETPEEPGSRSWDSACPRVCSYLVLKDLRTGRRLAFANTHTDHRSAEAREKGMLLVIERMKRFGADAPIVFTGDHNCTHDAAPAVAVRRMLKDARDISAKPDPGPRNTFHGFGRIPDRREGTDDPDRRIDYIYVSDGVSVLDFTTHADRREGTGFYPSDHYPVSATIRLD